MSSLGRLANGAALMTLAVLCAPAGGCGRSHASIELVSYKDPYSPERYTVRFAQCAYRRDAQGDYHIVGRVTRRSEDGDGGSITQLLYIHLFWKPQPGRTFANETTNNATIRYAISTAGGTVAYAGTGFVYPKHKRFGSDILVKLENARLRLESLTGTAPELLGDTRLSGEFTAEEDPNFTVDVLRELELRAAGATGETPNSSPGDQ